MNDHNNQLSLNHPAVMSWAYERIGIHGDQLHMTWAEYISDYSYEIHAHVNRPVLPPRLIFDSPLHLTHFLMKYSHERL